MYTDVLRSHTKLVYSLHFSCEDPAVFFSLVSFWFVCMFRSEALLSFRGTNIQYFSRPSRSLPLGCGIVCVEHPLVASVCFLDKLLCFWNIPSIHLLFYTIDCTRLFYKNRTLFIVFQITCTFNFNGVIFVCYYFFVTVEYENVYFISNSTYFLSIYTDVCYKNTMKSSNLIIFQQNQTCWSFNANWYYP